MISIHGECTHFDKDRDNHAHFYIPEQERILDIAPDDIGVGEPPAPVGNKISKVYILIHRVKVSDRL